VAEIDPEARRARLAELARRRPGAVAAEMDGLPLREQAELALRLPPAERLEVLLHSPKPMRLVRSLPDADLYLTVREVGPTDALPVLALASARQLLHLMDLESWRGDEFDAARAGAWAALLIEAGEPALTRWLREADDEVLALLFQRWLRVRPTDAGQDPDVRGPGETEAGTDEGFISPDGHHRFSPVHHDHLPVARRFAEAVHRANAGRYFSALEAAQWELPAELEERALRWRQSRLEEHGFPPWEEAAEVYAPAKGTAARAEPPPPADPDGLPVPRIALRSLPPGHALAAAVDRSEGPARERLLHEIASLANRLLVADGADLGDPEAHRLALERGGGYVSIALQARGAADPEAAARVLEGTPVLELFREGFARADALRQRVARLTRSGWASGHPRALELLDAPLRARVEGLLRPRPLYHEGTAAGESACRDFRALEELEATRAAVEMTESLGELFVGRLGLDLAALAELAPHPGDEVAPFSTLFLTTLAHQAVRGELRLEPLNPESAAEFVRRVASRRTAPPGAPERALNAFLAELTRTLDLESRAHTALAGFGRYALERLAEECGGLDPDLPVDPRSVSCLLLAAG
jgi:hypothetical protein